MATTTTEHIPARRREIVIPLRAARFAFGVLKENLLRSLWGEVRRSLVDDLCRMFPIDLRGSGATLELLAPIRATRGPSPKLRTLVSAKRYASMNECVLTFTDADEVYVDHIYADLDLDAIELAEAAAKSLCEGGWIYAILLDNEGGEIWTTRREPCT